MQIKTNSLDTFKNRLNDEYQQIINLINTEDNQYKSFKQMPIFQLEAFFTDAFINKLEIVAVSKKQDLTFGKILKIDNSKIIMQATDSNLFQIINKSDLKSIHLI